jgi:hypothetical protein
MTGGRFSSRYHDILTKVSNGTIQDLESMDGICRRTAVISISRKN